MYDLLPLSTAFSLLDPHHSPPLCDATTGSTSTTYQLTFARRDIKYNAFHCHVDWQIWLQNNVAHNHFQFQYQTEVNKIRSEPIKA